MLKGVDISKWQGEVKLSSVAKNQDFIIIRSSYGNGYTDEYFAKNRDECRKLKIPHGFYHYAYPNHNSPEDEADWFLHVVSPLESGESLFLDFEESYPDPVGWSKKFLDHLSEKLEGYKPLIYMNKHLVESYDWSPVVKKGYGLWLAYWDYDPNGTFNVSHWDVVAIRQYSNQGSVNGISGRVDMNVFYGDDIQQFLAYGVGTGDIPCKKLELENEQLKSDNKQLQDQNKGLQKSLDGLNDLYKKLLEDDEIDDEQIKKLVKNYDELMKIYKGQSDQIFKLDEKIQQLGENIEALLLDNQRLKLQEFTFGESLTFLLRSLQGGGKA